LFPYSIILYHSLFYYSIFIFTIILYIKYHTTTLITGVKLITLNELKKSSKIFENDEDINSYSAFILLSPCQESHYTDAIKLSNKYNNIPIIALNSPYSYRYDIGMIIINNIIINILIIITIMSINVVIIIIIQPIVTIILILIIINIFLFRWW